MLFAVFRYRSNIYANEINEEIFINIWNSLNNHVVACSTINSFVKHLKNVNMDTYLKGRAFK